MAEHERATNRKQGNSNHEHRAKQPESKPTIEKSYAWDEEKLSLAGTPFVPQSEKHTAILSNIPFSTRQREFIIRLNKTYGNRYVQHLTESMKVQRKLEASAPQNTNKQGADGLAEKVVRSLNRQVQRQPEDEEEEIQAKSLLQRASENGGPQNVSDLENKINAARENGKPLDAEILSPMENAFGADFSRVRTHTDLNADALSSSLNARAFTAGKDIFFKNGEYNPECIAGKQLLAHELTHVVQQTGGKLSGRNQNEEQLKAKSLNNVYSLESRIYRKAAKGLFGKVLQDTYLIKPNSKGDAPAKSIFSINRIGNKLNIGDSIELLDVTSPAKDPKWQLALHPKTGTRGFIKMSKVLSWNSWLSKGKQPHIDDEDTETKNTEDLKQEVVEGLGELFESGHETNDEAIEQAADLIMLRDEHLAWRLSSYSSEDKEELVKSVEEHVPWLENVLGSTEAKGVGVVTGLGGAVSGLIGMALGISKTFGSKSDMNERLEGILSASTGGLDYMASGMGMVGSGMKIAEEATKKDSFGHQLFESVTGLLKPVGDALKTLKTMVESVGIILKAFITLVSRAKKGIKTKASEVLATISNFGRSVLGTIKGAFNTAAGVLQWLKKLPGVSAVLGILGSVINIVSGVYDFFKTAIEGVTMGIEMKDNNERIQKLERNDDNKLTERNMLNKLRKLALVPPRKLKLTKDKKPDVAQIEEVLQEYKDPLKEKDNKTEQDYQKVTAYLVDRNLTEVLNKRINRGYSKIPEFIMGLMAHGVTILGGLTSVIADIAIIISSPSGVGPAIATAAKAIASIASGIGSAILNLGKTGYSLARTGVRKIKQLGRDKGWWGDQRKTTQAKQENRLRQTLAIMDMVSSLKNYDPSDKGSSQEYERVELRLEATGVNLKELFSMNGKPEDQAKEIFKALAKRE